MKKIIFLSLSIFLGCASITDLQKGDLEMGKGNLLKAREYYNSYLNEQKEDASSPVWSDYKFTYETNANDSAEAIFGIAETYRTEGSFDQAIYYYFYYIQFCLRHRISDQSRLDSIRAYIGEHDVSKSK